MKSKMCPKIILKGPGPSYRVYSAGAGSDRVRSVRVCSTDARKLSLDCFHSISRICTNRSNNDCAEDKGLANKQIDQQLSRTTQAEPSLCIEKLNLQPQYHSLPAQKQQCTQDRGLAETQKGLQSFVPLEAKAVTIPITSWKCNMSIPLVKT